MSVKRVFLNVDDLTIDGLGFSADRPLKKRKFDLTACIRELLAHGNIELGPGHTDPKHLFLKRGKGRYVVQFFEGPYFRQPLARPAGSPKSRLADDPLYEPLRAIGVDELGIRRLFKQHARGVIQRWVRITDAAMHDQPRGFPGFKTSPAAFLVDAIQSNRMPPDWMYAHEKERQRREWEERHRELADDEQKLREQHQAERAAALDAYLASSEGRAQYQALHPTFLEFYRQVEPGRFRQAAYDATIGKIEREHVRFPDFGVWLLTRRHAST